MKKILLLLPAILTCSFSAHAKLNVVATLPGFGSLAREIGGDKVNVIVLAKATEDPHFVDARPSCVVSWRGADMLIDGGAEPERGWLPPLLQNARSRKIEIGKPGRIQASQGVRLMNVPANVTRAAGDVHALGNPHFMSDPIIAKAVAQHIAQSFAALDPANAAFYDANYKKFEATINVKLQEWGAAMLPFKGQHVVAYHDSWPYFAHRFGLNIDIFLEPKPGIPPSPSHLTEVIAQMKAQHIKAIIVEPFHDRRIAEKVASATGAKVVEFSQFPGALPGTDGYVRLIDTAMAQMASLGLCLAVLFHLDLQSWTTFCIALGFTLIGGAIFSVTGKRSSQIPQEAVIGISYVVAAAAAVLLLSRAAEGDEEIKNMLVGNILLVTPHEVWKCFALFVVVGVFHFILRKNFLLVSFDRDGAYQKGLRVRWWDFLFYAAFGLVVTSLVRIAGVLLVFTYLIVPAVCGINLAARISHRLLIGWMIAWLGGIAGLFLSFWWDLPSGAAIVCTFGAILILISFFGLARHRMRAGAATDSQ